MTLEDLEKIISQANEKFKNSGTTCVIVGNGGGDEWDIENIVYNFETNQIELKIDD